MTDDKIDILADVVEGMIGQYLPDGHKGVRPAAETIVGFLGKFIHAQKECIDELNRELEMYRNADEMESVVEAAGLPWRAQLHQRANTGEGMQYPFDSASIWAEKPRDGVSRRYNVIAMWGIAMTDANLIVTAVNAYPKLTQRVRELVDLAYRYRRPGYEPETYQDLYHNVAQANAELLEEIAELRKQLADE